MLQRGGGPALPVPVQSGSSSSSTGTGSSTKSRFTTTADTPRAPTTPPPPALTPARESPRRPFALAPSPTAAASPAARNTRSASSASTASIASIASLASPGAHPPPHRKPVPRPLQQPPLNTFAARSNSITLREGALLGSSPRSPRSPTSPREKLDALLAEEDRPLQPAHGLPPAFPPAFRTQPDKPSSSAQLRNVSAPLLPSQVASPPRAPHVMAPPSRPARPETRPAEQRNHSIDSQLSSLSSNASTSQSYRSPPGHQYKPSQDAAPTMPPDMASLIAAAESPEAALHAMWKEKQSASNHNAQLWRLVEKQRAMIIGLNKDLERALKDKDRYRKKLKDMVNQVPPVPGAHKRSDTFESAVERGETPSPAPSEKQDESALSPPPSRAGEHRGSPLTQGTTATQMLRESQLAPSPPRSVGAPSASDPSSAAQSPTDYSVQPPHLANTGLGLDTIVHENASTIERPTGPVSVASPLRKGSNSSSQSSGSHAPALSLTQATPVLGGEGFTPTKSTYGDGFSPTQSNYGDRFSPTKPNHPLRKAPPAPLNLSNPSKTTSAHLHQAGPTEQSDDDYDDTLEVDDIPIVERGRRKTREDDDRVREAMQAKEDPARSKSKKKLSESESKSKPAPVTVAVAVENESVETEQKMYAAAPLSPRMFNPSAAGLPLSPRHPPSHSLNALLSPSNSDSSIMANRSLGSVGSSPLMSPGLPTSPRPGDRPLGSPLPRNARGFASPPMSPRSGVNGMQPRPPRQPIPLPPNTPLSFMSPHINREIPQPKQQTSSPDLLKPPNGQPSPDSDSDNRSQADMSNNEHVYRGLVSDQYPGLLLPPNALPSIDVKVFSSRLKPSRLSYMAPKPQEEDPVFTLAIYARSDGKQLWRLEKTFNALPVLEAQLRSLCDFAGRLPDRTLFSGHAPAKIDARRAALNHYFDIMLETPMSERAALVVCEFFSTDVIGVQNEHVLAPEPAIAVSTMPGAKIRQHKEGYLTKRGKNFGGWKARYFILDGPEFRYYEAAGGAHLGTIKLQNAQIGKQSQQQANSSPQRRDESEDNQYRHAFLILEPKRKDSSSLVRHVLCAESDDERDTWVDALLQHVDWQEEPSPTESHATSTHSVPTAKAPGQEPHPNRRDTPPQPGLDRVQGLSYDDTIAAQAPVRGPGMTSKETYASSPKTGSFSSDGSLLHPSISAPTNGAPIQNAEIWGNKLAAPTSVKDKKRSIFGFRGRASSDFAPGQIGGNQQQPDRPIPNNRNIFGIPLQEAVELSQPIGVRVQLPSVVYRCLEYLKGKKAYQEEGIFRLSGSNIVIKSLRERFNNEGDIKLLSGEYYDVHAVASLLKLYLRELPASILTRELHIDFLKVLDMDEREKKIQTFNVLVHRLPRVNFELLQAMSSFLIQIVDNADLNKMTVRNVGIVFAPTLNIPAPLISMFLTDFPEIFGMPVDETSSPINEIHVSAPPLGDEAIRSPRHQMFSDLPTPAYNQTSFQSMDKPMSFSGSPSLQPPQQGQGQGQYSGYNTGFIPLQQSYDAPMYEQQYQPQGEGGFGSLNGTVQPGNSAREVRQRRRESGMMLMNMGMQSTPRKGSNPRMREEPRVDPRMVREETAFD